jgi:capsule polysaccharide modification protein KpsS
MKVGVMQPYFFPYIGYWQLMNAVDRYVILDDVNFIKRGWINRNRILNGDKDEFIRITIENISQNRKIDEHFLFEKEKCFEVLRRTIREKYAKAPYFQETYSLIDSVLSFEGDNVADFLSDQIVKVCDHLDIDTEILRSSRLQKDESLKAQDRIIDLCRRLGADEYYNAIGGVELYDRESFEDAGMQLHFLKAHLDEYEQFGNAFVPGLSIIDVMMFNDVETVKKMLGDYELV